MAEIARTLGVSVQTVSAVVNGKGGISAATEARVRQVVTALDYRPNEQARTLRGVRAKTVGVIIPSITNPYFPEFVRGVEDAARAAGHSTLLCNTDGELDSLLEYFALIRSNRVSGIICSVGLAGRWAKHPEVVRWFGIFAQEDVSVVIVGGCEDPSVNAVVAETNDAVHEAAKHLIDLGHRRIGLTSPPPGRPGSIARIDSYRRAFQRLGHPLDEALIVPGAFDVEAGAEAARFLMSQPKPPTAIIAANDMAAFGVISALSEMDISVPDQVSVIGFDDIALSKVFQPALTTIAQPIYELGRGALGLATRSVTPGQAGEVLALDGRFIARKSTGPAR